MLELDLMIKVATPINRFKPFLSFFSCPPKRRGNPYLESKIIGKAKSERYSWLSSCFLRDGAVLLVELTASLDYSVILM